MVIARFLIGLVFVINVQCAGAFLLHPAGYMHGFGLEGIVGEQIVRALGLLFMMWNVPYAFALADPRKYRLSLIEAVIMQGIGFLGESTILLFGGPYSTVIDATILRFIFFDGFGWMLLIAAQFVMRKVKDTTGSS